MAQSIRYQHASHLLKCGGWRCFVLAALAVLAACHKQGEHTASGEATQNFGAVDARRLARAEKEPGEWFTPGGDASGAYYSRLELINDRNVSSLGFAWEYKLRTRRGLQATPVVVDGVMYTSGNWGWVYAINAATGRGLWTYDPSVEGSWGRATPTDVVNRGIAVWQHRIYVASLDGYVHCIDAATGKRIWKVDAVPSRSASGFHYFITGAPVVAGSVIVIGNGGGDFKGTRGSVAAFDLATGTFRWRFYTVPRDPRQGGQDQPHLDAAVKTWSKDYDWSIGGGASAWDGISYDAELNLVYFGTGNASPYHPGNLPKGSGDELYAASIIAVHADTGQMAWFYQAVPGDHWDYDATNKLVLTDLEIGGKVRKVLIQASKNGFLYVLDRASGAFLAGNTFSYVNWTAGLDPKTHRPVVTRAADWEYAPKLLWPNTAGAHSWQPMSFSLKTGLVYIPVIDAPMVYINTTHRPAGLIESSFNLAFYFPEDYEPKALQPLLGTLPPLERLEQGKPTQSRGVLRAVNPVSGETAWEQSGSNPWDGGVLSTAGNLVVRGDAAGFLNVYAADNGRPLKQIDVGTSMMAAPMTYSINGEQFIAIMAGYGGGLLFLPYPAGSAARRNGNEGRIVAFRLGGGPVPKAPPVQDPPPVHPPAREGTPKRIAAGGILYNRYCSRCHVFGVGLLPDLRQMSQITHQMFYEIVLNGAYQGKGMARWDDVLRRSDAEAIHAYLVDEAWHMVQPSATRSIH